MFVGDQAIIENCVVESVLSFGIGISEFCIVRDCTIANAIGTGITMVDSNIIEDCVITGSDEEAISGFDNNIVRGVIGTDIEAIGIGLGFVANPELTGTASAGVIGIAHKHHGGIGNVAGIKAPDSSPVAHVNQTHFIDVNAA